MAKLCRKALEVEKHHYNIELLLQTHRAPFTVQTKLVKAPITARSSLKSGLAETANPCSQRKAQKYADNEEDSLFKLALGAGQVHGRTRPASALQRTTCKATVTSQADKPTTVCATLTRCAAGGGLGKKPCPKGQQRQ